VRKYERGSNEGQEMKMSLGEVAGGREEGSFLEQEMRKYGRSSRKTKIKSR